MPVLSFWDAEPKRIEKLLLGFHRGDSYRKIADDLHTTCCAVTGKLNRLGFTRGNPVKPGANPKHTDRSKKPTVMVPNAHGHEYAFAFSHAQRPALKGPTLGQKAAPVVLPTPFRIRECCWPLNDGKPWKFCDAPADEGMSYCIEHCNRAYRKDRRYGEPTGFIPGVPHGEAATNGSQASLEGRAS